MALQKQCPERAGRIAKELGEISTTAITHQTGNYVLEKVIHFGDAVDVMAVLRPLCKDPYAFSSHRYGVMKCALGADKLVTPQPPPSTIGRDVIMKLVTGVDILVNPLPPTLPPPLVHGPLQPRAGHGTGAK